MCLCILFAFFKTSSSSLGWCKSPRAGRVSKGNCCFSGKIAPGGRLWHLSGYICVKEKTITNVLSAAIMRNHKNSIRVPEPTMVMPDNVTTTSYESDRK